MDVSNRFDRGLRSACGGFQHMVIEFAGRGRYEWRGRLMEYERHPFFVGTLFQPERSALQEVVHSLIRAFVQQAIRFANEKYLMDCRLDTHTPDASLRSGQYGYFKLGACLL